MGILRQSINRTPQHFRVYAADEDDGGGVGGGAQNDAMDDSGQVEVISPPPPTLNCKTMPKPHGR